jgi:hypothetical protein
MSLHEEDVRRIVREEIALWWTGGRTDSLYVVEEESAVSARNVADKIAAQTVSHDDDGPLVTEMKAILRGEKRPS